ncbi:YjbH domain-containing protein [Geobacter sp. SVR]|uniref:YjbH domain-containing protein n=1 Tax=Geobacter sp. SVR TaxID=2495594 RepID=UPI00143EFAC7|nr:YjbH domain-containing protein [Geobacter sp. SVR]BCS55025.1 hypothetical protein GSVR_33330 [Geobacter sp. SVR]GCF85206.1 hypothetical protein GSbR_18060 [Geobacter sp. SVR]
MFLKVLKSEEFVRYWLCLFLIGSVCISSGIASAEPATFHNGLSLQGYTGILNTPSAHVTEEGWFYGLYTNQKDLEFRNDGKIQENYLFSVGLFNFVELGGRFTELTSQQGGFIIRDLSASIKVTSEPLFRRYSYIPVLAAGIEDIGGGATFFRTKYIVGSQDIWRLRLSVGYGDGPDRMKGVFAGGEFKAHDWVYLLGEYDTRETNVGARIVLPQFWKVPIQFTATAKTSLDYKPGNFDVAVGFSLPLDFKVRKQGPGTGNRGPAEPSENQIPETEPSSESRGVVSSSEKQDSMHPVQKQGTTSISPNHQSPASDSPVSPIPNTQSPASDFSASGSGPLVPVAPPIPNLQSPVTTITALRDRLVQEGFINVRVGTTSSSALVIEYENARFNHNELDGVGMVAGIASQMAPEGTESLRMVLKRHDIPMVRLTMPLRTVQGFLEGSVTRGELNDALAVSFDTATDDADFLSGTANKGFLKSSLMIYPGLTTFIGTEFGVFDYVLSIKPDLLVNAWKGAVINARWDIPIAWSDNLNDGGVYSSSRNPARMERLMLFQAFKPFPDLMVNLGAGLIQPHIYGTLNEAMWSPGNGTHRFRVLQAYGENDRTHQDVTSYLGSYRYYLSPLDLYLEGTGGRFWAQDTGFSVEMKRFFGDSAVSVYYKNTAGTDDKRWQAAGIQFSFPLTFGRDMKHYYSMQVRGTDEWSYAQETTLKNHNVNDPRGSLNYLAPYPLAINPQPVTALYRAYYNRDRLSEAYIRGHLDRLRESWLRYKD